jgi:CRP/FNR family cyclic AMP-dependent transcriptional regulator
MEPKGSLPFDPKVFLSSVNGGRTKAEYPQNQIVFRQGDPADAVFYILKGKVKVTVVSEQGEGSRRRSSGVG